MADGEEAHEVGEQEEVGQLESDSLDVRALFLLGIQQTSSSFSYRAAEFAFPLYFISLFTNTLLPASIYGFVTTGSAILFSGSVGSLTDRYKTHRLSLARFFIVSQKLFIVGSYVLLLILFSSSRLRRAASREDTQRTGQEDVWTLFASVTLLGCFLVLCNVGVSVTIERDWVTSIAQGSTRRLTRLNAIMRRIDLVSKLVAPLIVSLFTSVTSEQHSCLILLSISAFSTLFEYIFIGIVFNRFTILGEEERGHRQREEEQQQQQTQEVHTVSRPNTYPPRRSLLRHHVTFHPTRSLATWAHRQYTDWKTFAVMPIFISSLSISLLYASVLSFDSTFIGYLKSETTYSNAFIAGMKSVCVVTGLMGTSLSPFLTEKIGLTRTGSWSLWSELTPLSLTIVSFYRGAQNKHRPAWNTALLFTGLSLSRIGLWSFDLAQLAQVQLALSLHPNRNALMGLQFALQNLFDLFHYVIVIIFNKPSSFRIPADISFAAVGVATILYVTVYARRERGHLIHLNKVDDLLSLIRKKET